jgi:hypothetical protein
MSLIDVRKYPNRIKAQSQKLNDSSQEEGGELLTNIRSKKKRRFCSISLESILTAMFFTLSLNKYLVQHNCTRFWWESPKERAHSEDQGVDGRMGSEWILGRLA